MKLNLDEVRKLLKKAQDLRNVDNEATIFDELLAVYERGYTEAWHEAATEDLGE